MRSSRALARRATTRWPGRADRPTDPRTVASALHGYASPSVLPRPLKYLRPRVRSANYVLPPRVRPRMVLFIDTVGVVGAGAMGSQIAEVFALNGKNVV